MQAHDRQQAIHIAIAMLEENELLYVSSTVLNKNATRNFLTENSMIVM